jgi:hypothetical protein
MRMLKCVSVTMIAAAVAWTTVGAQVVALPQGAEALQFPNVRQTKTGTGRIKGRLLTADTGAPVRRAQVRLTGTDILPRVMTTDNDGGFEFRDLPAGRFTLNASKSGYVSVGYGQTRPFQAPRPIELGEGQVLEKVEIYMPRGSAIAGRIVDEFGEPIADVTVTAMRSTWSNGRRRLQPVGRAATTNDLGQYRIYGLPPGEYYVSATARGGPEVMMAVEMAVTAVRLGGEPSNEQPRSGYAPTYYPGTPSGQEAQRITLGLGQEITSADFGLVPVRLARISGVVIGSDGRPVSGTMVTATPRNAGTGTLIIGPGHTARTDQNGNFTLNGVPPGDYTLTARGSIVVQSSGDGGSMTFTMSRVVTVGGGPGGGGAESGSVPVTVTGEDLTNVVIATTRGTTVSGRVVWEGAQKPGVTSVRVTATALDGDTPLAGMGAAAQPAEGTDTFEVRGVSGPVAFRVANIPAGWTLKAIRLNGADITDTGIDIRQSEPVTGLEVVLTNRITEVTGAVKAGNEPATDYTVVIFSQDPQKWLAPIPRHIASARPNQEGRFQLRGLPAGDYYAIAVEYIPDGDWNDPEVLDRLKTRAERFSVDEGEVKTIELTLESM